jgi:hypothetical protein
MKLLIMLFSPASCYFLHFWLKYSSQQPVARLPQFAVRSCLREIYFIHYQMKVDRIKIVLLRLNCGVNVHSEIRICFRFPFSFGTDYTRYYNKIEVLLQSQFTLRAKQMPHIHSGQKV